MNHISKWPWGGKMSVYVWLEFIKHMVRFDTMEKYYDSTTYEHTLQYGLSGFQVMVEKDTKQWDD